MTAASTLQWTTSPDKPRNHGAKSGNREYWLYDWYRPPGRVRVQLWVVDPDDRRVHQSRVASVDAGKALAQRWNSMTEAQIAKEANEPE